MKDYLIERHIPGVESMNADELRQAAAKMRGFKDVFENSLDVDPGAIVCIKAQRAEAKV